MKCPNCGATMRYLSSGKIYYCEYCKYEYKDNTDEPARGAEQQVIKEIHHVYEPVPVVNQFSTPKKKRSHGCLFAVLICCLAPILLMLLVDGNWIISVGVFLIILKVVTKK